MYFRYTLGLIFACLVAFPSVHLQGQDVQFSQFYHAPVYNNPAMAGVHKGRFRASLNYKSQWGAVVDNYFQTFNAQVDIRSRISRNDFLAYGFNAMQDRIGTRGITQTNGGATVAFIKQLGKARYRDFSQFLSLGANVSVGQQKLENDLWFSNQYDPLAEDIDFNLDSGENLLESTGIYPDLSAGILYYAVFGPNSFYIGGSASHLNRPNVSLVEGSTSNIATKFTGQIGGEFSLSDEISILPAFIVHLQGPATISSVGANLRYSNSDWREVALRAGGWVSFSKNIETGLHTPYFTTSFILEIERFQLGLSYDLNTGSLAQPTDSRGSFELGLIYVHPAKLRDRVKCPKL